MIALLLLSQVSRDGTVCSCHETRTHLQGRLLKHVPPFLRQAEDGLHLLNVADLLATEKLRESPFIESWKVRVGIV